jgi:hypothetical protein
VLKRWISSRSLAIRFANPLDSILHRLTPAKGQQKSVGPILETLCERNFTARKAGERSVSQPIIKADWKASSGNVWTVPFGLGVGGVMKVGAQPFNFTSQLYGNAVYPNGGSSWSWRPQIALLFPRLSKEQEKMLLEQKLKQLEESSPKQ